MAEPMAGIGRLDLAPDGTWTLTLDSAAAGVREVARWTGLALGPGAYAWLRHGRCSKYCASCRQPFVPVRAGQRFCGRACRRRGGRQDG